MEALKWREDKREGLVADVVTSKYLTIQYIITKNYMSEEYTLKMESTIVGYNQNSSSCMGIIDVSVNVEDLKALAAIVYESWRMA